MSEIGSLCDSKTETESYLETISESVSVSASASASAWDGESLYIRNLHDRHEHEPSSERQQIERPFSSATTASTSDSSELSLYEMYRHALDTREFEIPHLPVRPCPPPMSAFVSPNGSQVTVTGRGQVSRDRDSRYTM